MAITPELLKKMAQAAETLDEVALELSAQLNTPSTAPIMVFGSKDLHKLVKEWQHKVDIELMAKDLFEMHDWDSDLQYRARYLVEDCGWRPVERKNEGD